MVTEEHSQTLATEVAQLRAEVASLRADRANEERRRGLRRRPATRPVARPVARPGRWLRAGALTFSALAATAGVALAQGMLVKLDCPGGQLICFGAGEPALASDINHNFAQLKAWIENKAGGVDSSDLTVSGDILSTKAGGQIAVSPGFALRDEGDDRLHLRAGAGSDTSASLQVQDAHVDGNLTVAGNITNFRVRMPSESDIERSLLGRTSFLVTSLAGFGPLQLQSERTLTSDRNSICFLSRVAVGKNNTDNQASVCDLTRRNGSWVLSASGAPIDCGANCLTW
ncbi:MAG: hypothetical protein OXU20_28840 [Myxococcales bacterium]|nr:hypothetical protein [Myxococcales bacterium]